MLNNKISLAALVLGILVALPAEAQVINNGAYDACIKASGGSDMKMIECTVQETNRFITAIEGKYETLSNVAYFKNWNKGSGMYSGNFKNLFTEWKTYADKYCLLYGYSISPDGTIGSLSSAECLLELSKRQNKDMDVIIKNYKENE